MDKEVYEDLVKRAYDIGRAYSQISRAEIIIRRLLEDLEDDCDMNKKLEEVHDILGCVLFKLEY